MTALDRLIANSNSIIEALVTFGSNIPQDVTFTWINDDNTTTDVNYMNIVKYQAYLKNLIGMDDTGAVTNSLKLGGVDANLLINKLNDIEEGATADQTPEEIAVAYNSIVEVATSTDIVEAGNSIKTWSPSKIKEAILTHASDKIHTIDTNTRYKDNVTNKLYKFYIDNGEVILDNVDVDKTTVMVDEHNVYDYIRESNVNDIIQLIDVNGVNCTPERWMVGLTSSNEFIFWGYNWNSVFLTGPGCDNIGYFTLYNPKPNVPVRKMIASNFDLFILYEDNELYALGYNHYGEFGLNNTAYKYELTLCNTDVADVYVSGSGYHVDYIHTMVLKTSGKLFATGANNQGQTGCGDKTTTYIWRLVTLPANVGLPLKVFTINTNNAWSYIITDTGKLLFTGYGSYGQSGLGNTNTVTEFTEISTLDDEYIIDLAAHGGTRNGGGAYYRGATIALTDDHKLYGFGGNSQGQLGLGHSNVIKSPELITVDELTSDDYIVKIYSSKGEWGNFYLLSNNGHLFVSGYGGNGQTGLGNNNTINKFKKVMSNVKEFFIFSGNMYNIYTSCFVITADNAFYAWGYNGHGQLGLNDTVNRNIPTKVHFNYTDKIKMITSSGYNNTYTIYILLTDGRIYSTGYNDYQNVTMKTSSRNIRRFIRTI